MRYELQTPLTFEMILPVEINSIYLMLSPDLNTGDRDDVMLPLFE